MPRRNLYSIVMVGGVSLFCWQATQGAKPKDEMMELYGVFVDAVEQVEANYVRPGQSPRAARRAPLKGMLQNLDPHSSYINTSEWKQFKRQIEGRFGGIGIQVGMDPRREPPQGDRADGRHPGLRGGRPGRRPDHGDRRPVDRGDEPPTRPSRSSPAGPAPPVKLTVLHEGTRRPRPSR